MKNIKQFISDFGWPRIIILFFLVSLFVTAPFVGVRLDASISDVLARFGRNAIFVLALVPMVQSGCGLNFGLSIGILAGLLGAAVSLQFNVFGALGFGFGLAVAIPFAVLFGWLYGKLLNKVKGEEMTIAIYVGFASVMFMCIMWVILPFNNPNMVWAYAGTGLRTNLTVNEMDAAEFPHWRMILDDFLAIRMGPFFKFPTGILLFVAFCAFLVRLFMRTRTGTALTAVGSNPDYARASGVSVDRMRTVSVVVSTVLGAVGSLVYSQSYGFAQLYLGPLLMPFAAIAALLIGGASVKKASIVNVIVGAFLFQGLLTMTPSVINSIVKSDMSEVVRVIVSNGIILYALTRKTKVSK